jgi:hypothetical protein
MKLLVWAFAGLLILAGWLPVLALVALWGVLR